MKWSKAQLGWKSSWKFLDSMEPIIKKPRKKPRKQAKDREAAMEDDKRLDKADKTLFETWEKSGAEASTLQYSVAMFYWTTAHL